MEVERHHSRGRQQSAFQARGHVLQQRRRCCVPLGSGRHAVGPQWRTDHRCHQLSVHQHQLDRLGLRHGYDEQLQRLYRSGQPHHQGARPRLGHRRRRQQLWTGRFHIRRFGSPDLDRSHAASCGLQGSRLGRLVHRVFGESRPGRHDDQGHGRPDQRSGLCEHSRRLHHSRARPRFARSRGEGQLRNRASGPSDERVDTDHRSVREQSA